MVRFLSGKRKNKTRKHRHTGMQICLHLYGDLEISGWGLQEDLTDEAEFVATQAVQTLGNLTKLSPRWSQLHHSLQKSLLQYADLFQNMQEGADTLGMPAQGITKTHGIFQGTGTTLCSRWLILVCVKLQSRNG